MSCDPKTMHVGERLDYGFNYRRELLFGDLLSTSSWAIEPTATLSGGAINATEVIIDSESVPAYMAASVFLSGVSVGAYVLTNTATTVQGRTFVRSMAIEVS